MADAEIFLGFFILERFGKSSYERDGHTLSNVELRTVQAFAEALFHDRETCLSFEEIGWNVDRHMSRLPERTLIAVKRGLWLIENALRFAPLAPSFSKMEVKDRITLIRATMANPDERGLFGLTRDIGRLRYLIYAGYYGDKKTHRELDYAEPEAKLGPRTGIKPYEPSGAEIDADVCVIGSGAGGAIVAARAAKDGKDVVVLEAGPMLESPDISHNEVDMSAALYLEGGLQTDTERDMAVLQGRCLGGSTVINNCICFRVNDERVFPGENRKLFQQWHQEFGITIDEGELDHSYCAVATRLNIHQIDERIADEDEGIAGGNGSLFLEGWKRLQEQKQGIDEAVSGYFRKNYTDDCLGCGYCNTGCRYGKKNSMLETYLLDVYMDNAKLIWNCRALRINTKRGHALHVDCRRADGTALRVTAGTIVVACGAIASSTLLLNSGIARARAGRRLSFNAGSPMLARFGHQVRTKKQVQLAAYVDCGDYMLESVFHPPMGLSLLMPGWLECHFDRMHRYNNLAGGGVLIGTEATGRVIDNILDDDEFGKIKYSMSKQDLMLITRGLKMLARLFFAAGAEEVYPPTVESTPLNPDDDLDILDRLIQRADDIALSSAHPQGGNMMCDDPSRGVVDNDYRVHGFDNLYVCDASIFPTSIRVNPQWTIMAMAHRFAARCVWK